MIREDNLNRVKEKRTLFLFLQNNLDNYIRNGFAI